MDSNRTFVGDGVSQTKVKAGIRNYPSELGFGAITVIKRPVVPVMEKIVEFTADDKKWELTIPEAQRIANNLVAAIEVAQRG